MEIKSLNHGSFLVSALSFLSDQKSLESLEVWKVPEKPQLNLPAKSFSCFLPLNLDNLKVGDIWHLVPVKSDLLDEQFSNSLYEPPQLASPERQIVLFKILQMFHRNAFIYTRFAPQGAAMYLRAFNDEYLDILFRIHAEYQLNEPPRSPFWFTPGSFNGRLVIARNATRIKLFNLFVPNTNRLNVDMEWMSSNKDGENMEVDIGYMNRMEVISSDESSVLAQGCSVDFKPAVAEHKESVEFVDWVEEVDVAQGYEELEKVFFPFKKVKYYSFLDAFKVAARTKKLVHFIMLWGALDVRIKR